MTEESRPALTQKHWCDETGAPEGGHSFGPGFAIAWQRGPLGAVGSPDRQPQNGAFVEDVLAACLGRLECYQASRFACPENEAAVNGVKNALAALHQRTANRVQRKVEGTHGV
jgi:hypothetical protein